MELVTLTAGLLLYASVCAFPPFRPTPRGKTSAPITTIPDEGCVFDVDKMRREFEPRNSEG